MTEKGNHTWNDIRPGGKRGSVQSRAERMRRGVGGGHGTGDILEVDSIDLGSHWQWGGRQRVQVRTVSGCQA